MLRTQSLPELGGLIKQLSFNHLVAENIELREQLALAEQELQAQKNETNGLRQSIQQLEKFIYFLKAQLISVCKDGNTSSILNSSIFKPHTNRSPEIASPTWVHHSIP